MKGDELIRNLIHGRLSKDAIEASGLRMSDTQSLSDEQLTLLCDRAEAYRKLAPTSLDSCVAPMSATLETQKPRYAALVRYLKGQAQAKPGFRTFVYSHTHRADATFRPVDGLWSPWVVNTGAFQRVISPEEIEDHIGSNRLSRRDVIALRHTDLPKCYTFVEVESSGKAPNTLAVQLLGGQAIGSGQPRPAGPVSEVPEVARVARMADAKSTHMMVRQDARPTATSRIWQPHRIEAVDAR